MNKLSKSLIVLFLTFLFGSCFSVCFVQAQSNDLILETIKECKIQYTGDSCIAELKLNNNTGEVLDGTAFLSFGYQGVCGDSLNGEGIGAQLSINNGDWLDFSNWDIGTATLSGFDITKGETQPKLKIETIPNLCPGKYSFIFTLKGTAETGEEYTTTPAIIGGGGGSGGYTPSTTPNTNTGRVIATPGEGGITTLITADGNKVKLAIPPGAISGNTVFTIERLDVDSVNQPSPESGLFFIDGLVYEIKAERDGEFITTFDKPLTLTFTYTDEQIEGLDENSLKIYYWDGKKWVVLESSESDIDNNTVTVLIDHLTLFALMGSKIKLVEGAAKEWEESSNEQGLSEAIKELPEKMVKGIKKIIEGIIPSTTTDETKKPSVSEEVSLPEKIAPSDEVKIPQRDLASMLATVGMIWGEISKSFLLTIVVILCLTGLAFIGIREWRLYRRKEKK